MTDPLNGDHAERARVKIVRDLRLQAKRIASAYKTTLEWRAADMLERLATASPPPIADREAIEAVLEQHYAGSLSAHLNAADAILALRPGRDPLVEENQRLRDKIEQFTNGDTFLVLRDEDRDKAACDLDDASLVKWVRWALTRVAETYQEKADRDQRSLMEVTTQNGVISLALLVLGANATTATFDVEGVTYRGEEKGDWRVTIEQIREALHGIGKEEGEA